MTMVKEISEHFADYPVFTYRDVRLYLGADSISPEGLSRLMSHMKSTGRIRTIRKGVYTMSDDIMVTGFAFAPFYYGLLSALTIRELWTQNSRPEIMTLSNVRRSRIELPGNGSNVFYLHHTPMKYFFGFDVVRYGKLKIPVSVPEKTLIDLFHYKVKLAVQNYGGLLKAVDRRKLREYLEPYGSRTSKSVMDFVKRYKPAADSGKLDNPY